MRTAGPTTVSNPVRAQRAGRPRLPAIVCTLGLHLAALSLFLWFGTVIPPTEPPAEALSTFEVIPEPEQPPPPQPPPPQPPPPQPAVRKQPSPERPADSGSPRASRAPIAIVSSVELPRIADITIMPDEPLAVPSGAGDHLTAGTDLLPASGQGTGGSGSGSGDGIGTGGSGVKMGPMRRALWIYHPPPWEVQRHWPPDARANRVSGHVILACVVPRPGRPTGCHVHSETPQGMGFGSAAMRLWPKFLIRPVIRDKKVMDLPIFVPVAFSHRKP